MNNTFNTQPIETQNQYRQLTLNSPLFKDLEPAGYNLYDWDANAIHIHKLEFRHYKPFFDIERYTRLDTKTVTYWIEPDGVICFSIYDTVDKNSESIFIHELSRREAVEDIFQIKLGAGKETLASVNKYNFSSRMKDFFSPDAFSHSYTNLYLNTEAEGEFAVDARTVDDYKAGVAHMKYLIDSLPDFTWYKRQGGINKTETLSCKSLNFDRDMGWLYLSFRRLRNRKVDSFYFRLDLNAISEEVKLYEGYANEELFQKLKPMYRKQSLVDILKSI